MKSYSLLLPLLAILSCFSAAHAETRTLPAASIKAIETDGGIKIQYVAGPVTPVVITGSSEALENIDASVADGVLRIQRRHPDCDDSPAQQGGIVEVTVNSPEVSRFRLGTGTILTCSGLITTDNPFEFECVARCIVSTDDIRASAINLKLGPNSIFTLGALSSGSVISISAKEQTIVNTTSIKAADTVSLNFLHKAMLHVTNEIESRGGKVLQEARTILTSGKWVSSGPVDLSVGENGIFNTGFISGPSLEIKAGAQSGINIPQCASRIISAEGNIGSIIQLGDIDAESVTATTNSGQIVLSGRSDFGALTSKNGHISQGDFQIGSSDKKSKN